MANIRLMKLITGEEIIGKVIDEDERKITLGDVRVLVAHPSANGQMAIGMIPWLTGAPENDIEIDKSRIIGVPIGDLPKQLEDGYLQQTSGLAFASSSAVDGI